MLQIPTLLAPTLLALTLLVLTQMKRKMIAMMIILVVARNVAPPRSVTTDQLATSVSQIAASARAAHRARV